MKDSIRKLRELRENLCSQQGTWKEAFTARDKVIADLVDVYMLCIDKKTRKKQIEKKLLCMFEYLQVDPHETENE